MNRIYDEHKDRGIISFYFWGSIARDDWDLKISDIDTIAITNEGFDLQVLSTLKQQAKDEFSHKMKFGIQLYVFGELNGQEPRTMLARYQPPGYLLLRFGDWIHAAGQELNRSDFTCENFTAKEARSHQLGQSLRALRIVNGELPVDPGRASGMQSMVEDVVKGAIGALYWEAVDEGYTERLNYDTLPEIVRGDRKALASKLVEIRKTGSLTLEAVSMLQPEIESLI